MSEAAQEQKTERWRGVLMQQVQVPTDKAWSVLRDFCGLAKFVKTINSSDRIEGEDFKPGCVRLVKSSLPTEPGGEKIWAEEQLNRLDDENRTQDYELRGNNLGLEGYKASLKVDHVDEQSSMVTWSFETNPIEGSTEEATAQNITGLFANILKALEVYCHDT